MVIFFWCKCKTIKCFLQKLPLNLVVMWGINYMLVHLGVLVAELVLMVQISERVVLRKCTGYLGKKFVWIIVGFLGRMSVKTDVVVVG